MKKVPFYYIRTFLLIILFLPFQGKSQNTAAPKLLLSMNDLGSEAGTFIKLNNIGYVKLVGQAYIDPNDNMVVSQDLLKNQIAKLFPDKNSSGIGVLDWEGKAMASLEKCSLDDPQFVTVMKQFQLGIEIGKALRPNVKWTVYGLPFREYWNMNSTWEARCLKLMPLLKECDIIAPSLYNPYPDSVSRGRDKQYVAGNMQMALKMGVMLGKPVYPYIWHRLPNHDLIPKDEFLNHTAAILNQSYKGTKAAGLIWWGADQYFYNVKSKPLLMEVGDKSNFTSYHDNWFINYAGGVLDLIKNSR